MKGGTGLKMRPGTYSGYEVWQWVIRKVEEEPKRLNMKDWVLMFKGEERQNFHYVRNVAVPECGTVACMAGWVGLARGNAHMSGSSDGLRGLGLTYATTEGSRASSDLYDLFMSCDLPKREVIKRAKALGEKHKGVLQKTRVEVPRGWGG